MEVSTAQHSAWGLQGVRLRLCYSMGWEWPPALCPEQCLSKDRAVNAAVRCCPSVSPRSRSVQRAFLHCCGRVTPWSFSDAAVELFRHFFGLQILSVAIFCNFPCCHFPLEREMSWPYSHWCHPWLLTPLPAHLSHRASLCVLGAMGAFCACSLINPA